MLVWSLAGFRQLDPRSEFGVLDSPLLGRWAMVVDGPVAVAPPGLLRFTRYPSVGIELGLPQASEAMLAARDGTRFGFRGWATLQPRRDEWRLIHDASGGDGLRGVLRAALRAAAAELPPGAEAGMATAALENALRERLDGELAARGVVLRRVKIDAVDFLMAAEGDDTPATDARVLLIGLDGADWEIVDDLIRRGKLPNLRRLIEDGTRAKLLSISPMLSPVIWTTVATGVEPGRHGVLDFLVEDPAGGPGQPVTSAQRRAATVWEMLSRAGVPVGVVGWWASWPADPVNGYIVSDRVAYQLFGYRSDPDDSAGKTWPPETYAEIRERIRAAADIPWERVRGYLGESRREPGEFDDVETEMLDEFRTLLASGDTYVDIAKTLRESFDPRLEAVYLEGTDTIGHLFMRYRPPRLPGVDDAGFDSFRGMVDLYYETADRYVGELLADRSADWTVIVVSDHGFASDATRPRLTDSRIGHGAAADWHRRFGVLVLSGAHVRRGGEVGEASVYDIAPTILALFGQPVPRSWPGRVLGQAIDADFLAEHPVRLRADDPVREPPPEAVRGPALDPAARELLAKLKTLGYVSSAEAGTPGASPSNNAGVTLLTEGRFTEAEEAFRAALETQGETPTVLVNLAVSLRGQGRREEARDLLEQAFEFVATRRKAGHLLAQIALELGDVDEAERYLRLVLRAEPGAADVHTTLGALLEQQGRSPEASAAYRRAAELDPDAAPPRNSLGNLARREGDLERAERWYRAAIDADPYFMGAYNNLALVYQDLGRLDRATDLYSEALTKSPMNAVVLNNLASLYYARGDHAEAAKLWRRSAAADPAYPSPLNNLAGVEIQAGRFAEAERLLRRAMEIDPDYGDARINLALVHRRRGEPDRARPELQRAAEDPRARLQALAQLGSLEFESRRFDRAIEALEVVRLAGTTNAVVLNILGESYRQTGQRDRAAAAWRESLGLRPDQPELARRLAELES